MKVKLVTVCRATGAKMAKMNSRARRNLRRNNDTSLMFLDEETYSAMAVMLNVFIAAAKAVEETAKKEAELAKQLEDARIQAELEAEEKAKQDKAKKEAEEMAELEVLTAPDIEDLMPMAARKPKTADCENCDEESCIFEG